MLAVAAVEAALLNVTASSSWRLPVRRALYSLILTTSLMSYSYYNRFKKKSSAMRTKTKKTNSTMKNEESMTPLLPLEPDVRSVTMMKKKNQLRHAIFSQQVAENGNIAKVLSAPAIEKEAIVRISKTRFHKKLQSHCGSLTTASSATHSCHMALISCTAPQTSLNTLHCFVSLVSVTASSPLLSPLPSPSPYRQPRAHRLPDLHSHPYLNLPPPISLLPITAK